jgi:pimeloyl-ACP methyl ester carboxylesterase
MMRDASQMPPQGQITTLNGMDMYYEVMGEGPPLILLHNFLGSSQAWEQPFKVALAQAYRVVIPDLRGHGRSSNPANTFTHRQAAQDIFALLDHLQLDRYRAIGASSGAMTLLHMATQQPERSEALVLIGGTSYFSAICRAVQLEITPDSLPPETWQILRDLHPQGDDQIRTLIQHFHGMTEMYDDMNFTPPYLGTIVAPTLIIHGDRDAFFPITIPVEIYQAIPRAYLWIVPNASHLDPVGGYADTPVQARTPLFKEYFTQTVLDFLRQGWGTAASETA